MELFDVLSLGIRRGVPPLLKKYLRKKIPPNIFEGKKKNVLSLPPPTLSAAAIRTHNNIMRVSNPENIPSSPCTVPMMAAMLLEVRGGAVGASSTLA